MAFILLLKREINDFHIKSQIVFIILLKFWIYKKMNKFKHKTHSTPNRIEANLTITISRIYHFFEPNLLEKSNGSKITLMSVFLQKHFLR